MAYNEFKGINTRKNMKNNLVLQDYKANLLCELFFGNKSSYAAIAEIMNATTLNGGFETAGGGGADVFANWTEYKTSTSTITRDTAEQRTGAACCKLGINATGSEAGVYQNILTIGKKYKASFYAKVGVADGTIIFKDSNSNIIYTTSALTTDYTLYEFYFVATTTRFYLCSTSANKTIYIDDVILTPYEQETDTTGTYNAGVNGTLESETIISKPAMKFTDARTCAIIAPQTALNVGIGAKTYLIWAKAISLVANTSLLHFESSNINFCLTVAGNLYLYAFDVDEAEELEVSIAGAVAGTWHLYGFYIDVPNLTCGLIKDGEIVTTHALDAAVTSFATNNKLVLGTDPQFVTCFDGYVKTLRIYDGVLEAHRLKNIYNFTKRQVLGLAAKS